MEKLDIKMMKVAEILPYAANPRKIGQDAVKAVASSISAYGFNQPIVVDEKNIVIVGHTRLLACGVLGLTEAPVLVKTGLTEAQKRAYRIVDNKSGEKAAWDYGLLQCELQDLDVGDEPLAAAFTQDELDVILQADFNPASGSSDEESDENKKHTIVLTAEQHAVFAETLTRAQEQSDTTISEGQFVVMLCQEFKVA